MQEHHSVIGAISLDLQRVRVIRISPGSTPCDIEPPYSQKGWELVQLIPGYDQALWAILVRSTLRPSEKDRSHGSTNDPGAIRADDRCLAKPAR